MASCSKRRRFDEEPSEFHFCDISFHVKEHRMRDVAVALNTLCLTPHITTSATVRPLQILNCNAADMFGVPFSKAYCSVATNKEIFLLTNIFKRGMELIVEFVTKRKLPTGKQEKYILYKLMQFINTDEEIFQDIEELRETDLTTVLANHLFGRLSTSCDYIIDKTCSGKGGKNRCHCEKEDCKLTGSYGDTSIGNDEVWHGNVDIMINNDNGVLPVVNINNDIGVLPKEELESPGEKSVVKVKLKSANLSRNSQVIAETIVLSFLQKKRHPENNHFLTPCIGVGSSEMVMVFYDAENDVLLESSCIPLLEPRDKGASAAFSIGAIIVSWLVVNYKYLCNGLPDDMKSLMKADFFIQAKKKIRIYEKSLKFQNVCISSSSENLEEDKTLTVNPGMFSFELQREVSAYLMSQHTQDKDKQE